MTRNDPDLYDVDFFTWTQRQTAALRAMSQDASVDAEHVAEEIADLGKFMLDEMLVRPFDIDAAVERLSTRGARTPP